MTSFKLPSLLIILIAFFSSCTDQVEITRTFKIFEPVYMSPEEIRSAVAVEEPQEIESAGKIYLYKQYLFVNEPSKGIHVINNQDPSKPSFMQFINIPGNYDISVRGDALFADSYVDLVVFDIKNIEAIKETGRLENVFYTNSVATYYDNIRGVIVDWNEVEKVTVEYEPSNGIYPEYFWDKGNLAFSGGLDMAATRSSFMPPSTVTGVGGSMARFAIVDEYMYSVDANKLSVFDISDLQVPTVVQQMNIGWGIETIFPFRQNIFIGSQTGMYIYSIEQPSNPALLSFYQHIRRCDPVVANDTHAFVTLRGGGACGGTSNELHVLDIQDLTQPRLLKTYAMTEPHGLGIDDNALFICDGSAGLKVYDATDVYAITDNMIATYPSIRAYDVIPFNDLLIMTGDDGIRQFDYSNPAKIKLLSSLAVSQQ